MDKHDYDVVVAGGGPTGLMLAGELALAGASVAVVERRHTQVVNGSRSGGLHARTLEELDQRGIVDRFLAAGEAMQIQAFAQIPLSIGDLPTRFNHGLALWQSKFEPILAGWVEELGVPMLRGTDVVGLRQFHDRVEVATSRAALRCQYLVGCDGGRSLVRKSAGIAFPGTAATTSWMIAEVDMAGDPELGPRRDDVGVHVLGRRAPGEPVRVVLTEPELREGPDPTIDDLRTALHAVYQTDFGLTSAHWVSRFTDAARQAERYRQGRVLLAGDAAHVHSPHGGQGLNTGVQDATNLGWKLARVVNGDADNSLLDTYHSERHPVAAQVLQNTLAAVALSTSDPRHDALRTLMSTILTMDGPRKHVAAMMAGLDIRYDTDQDHPLVGRRMPDLTLRRADGPCSVFGLLHAARPLLISFLPVPPDSVPRLPPDVHHIEARHANECEIPVVGHVHLPPAVLVRPDGYVAWAGSLGDDDLVATAQRWFGRAHPE